MHLKMATFVRNFKADAHAKINPSQHLMPRECRDGTKLEDPLT
jgi:hypothetical protein